MSPLGSLLAVFLVFLGGHGLLRLLRHRPNCGPESFGLSFLAGCVLLALLAALLSPFGAARAPLLVPLLLLAPFLAWRLRRPKGTELLDGWLLFLGPLLLTLPVFALALGWPSWNVDALMRWILHGRWMATSGSLFPAFVRAPEWASAHPSYPPLVSALIGLALQLGADPDLGSRLLFPFFLVALLGVVHGFALRHAGPLRAPLVSALLAATPCLSWLPAAEGAYGLGAAAALADLPLAMALTAAACLLLQAWERPEHGPWGLLALCCVGAVLTKQEGAAFVPLMLLSGMVCTLLGQRGELRGRRLRGQGAALAAVLAAILGWKFLARGLPVAPGEDYLSPAGLAEVFAHLDRLPAIAAAFGAEFLRWRSWGILWLAALLAAGLLLRRNGTSRARLLPLLWLLLGCGVATAGYLASGWHEGDFRGLMAASSTRLLIHHAPLAALLVAEALPRSFGPARKATTSGEGLP